MNTSATDKQSRSRVRRAFFLRRFLGETKGATAIEFGALILPFALLVFAILESCISFAGQQLLANSADEVARRMRTGSVRTAEVTETWLKTELCEPLKILFGDDCVNEILVDLQEYPTFEAAADKPMPLIGSGNQRDIVSSGFKAELGPSMSKNMMRVFYKWPVITDLMRKSMSNLKDGKIMHFAVVVWQNEPFSD